MTLKKIGSYKDFKLNESVNYETYLDRDNDTIYKVPVAGKTIEEVIKNVKSNQELFDFLTSDFSHGEGIETTDKFVYYADDIFDHITESKMSKLYEDIDDNKMEAIMAKYGSGKDKGRHVGGVGSEYNLIVNSPEELVAAEKELKDIGVTWAEKGKVSNDEHPDYGKSMLTFTYKFEKPLNEGKLISAIEGGATKLVGFLHDSYDKIGIPDEELIDIINQTELTQGYFDEKNANVVRLAELCGTSGEDMASVLNFAMDKYDLDGSVASIQHVAAKTKIEEDVASDKRIKALAAQLSKIAGIPVEITIRGEKEFTVSFEGDNQEAFNKIKNFLGGQVQWTGTPECEYDEPTQYSCAYFTVKDAITEQKLFEEFEEYYTVAELEQYLKKNDIQLDDAQKREVTRVADVHGGLSPEEFGEFISSFANQQLADKWINSENRSTEIHEGEQEKSYTKKDLLAILNTNNIDGENIDAAGNEVADDWKGTAQELHDKLYQYANKKVADGWLATTDHSKKLVEGNQTYAELSKKLGLSDEISKKLDAYFNEFAGTEDPEKYGFDANKIKEITGLGDDDCKVALDWYMGDNKPIKEDDEDEEGKYEIEVSVSTATKAFDTIRDKFKKDQYTQTSTNVFEFTTEEFFNDAVEELKSQGVEILKAERIEESGEDLDDFYKGIFDFITNAHSLDDIKQENLKSILKSYKNDDGITDTLLLNGINTLCGADYKNVGELNESMKPRAVKESKIEVGATIKDPIGDDCSVIAVGNYEAVKQYDTEGIIDKLEKKMNATKDSTFVVVEQPDGNNMIYLIDDLTSLNESFEVGKKCKDGHGEEVEIVAVGKWADVEKYDTDGDFGGREEKENITDDMEFVVVKTATGRNVIYELDDIQHLNEANVTDVAFFDVQFGLSHAAIDGKFKEEDVDTVLSLIPDNRIKIDALKTILTDKGFQNVDELIGIITKKMSEKKLTEDVYDDRGKDIENWEHELDELALKLSQFGRVEHKKDEIRKELGSMEFDWTTMDPTSDVSNLTKILNFTSDAGTKNYIRVGLKHLIIESEFNETTFEMKEIKPIRQIIAESRMENNKNLALVSKSKDEFEAIKNLNIVLENKMFKKFNPGVVESVEKLLVENKLNTAFDLNPKKHKVIVENIKALFEAEGEFYNYIGIDIDKAETVLKAFDEAGVKYIKGKIDHPSLSKQVCLKFDDTDAFTKAKDIVNKNGWIVSGGSADNEFITESVNEESTELTDASMTDFLHNWLEDNKHAEDEPLKKEEIETFVTYTVDTHKLDDNAKVALTAFAEKQTSSTTNESDSFPLSKFGYEKFEEDGKFGLKNKDGEIVLQPEYSFIDDTISANGMIMVKDEKGEKIKKELSDDTSESKIQFFVEGKLLKVDETINLIVDGKKVDTFDKVDPSSLSVGQTISYEQYDYKVLSISGNNVTLGNGVKVVK